MCSDIWPISGPPWVPPLINAIAAVSHGGSTRTPPNRGQCAVPMLDFTCECIQSLSSMSERLSEPKMCVLGCRWLSSTWYLFPPTCLSSSPIDSHGSHSVSRGPPKSLYWRVPDDWCELLIITLSRVVMLSPATTCSPSRIGASITLYTCLCGDASVHPPLQFVASMMQVPIILISPFDSEVLAFRVQSILAPRPFASDHSRRAGQARIIPRG